MPAYQPLSAETQQAVDDLYQKSCEGLWTDQRHQLQELLDSLVAFLQPETRTVHTPTWYSITLTLDVHALSASACVDYH